MKQNTGQERIGDYRNKEIANAIIALRKGELNGRISFYRR